MITQKALNDFAQMARQGADSAALTLSRWLHREVKIPVSTVDVVRIDAIPGQNGSDVETTVTMASRVYGELPGNIAIQLPLSDAMAVVSCLGSRLHAQSPASSLGEMEISMLQETANILFSTLMNSLANHLGLVAVPHSPGVIVDIGTAAWDTLLMESALDGDEAVVVTARLACIGSGPTIRLVFIPSPLTVSNLSQGA
jgi:chemotaxis protein CheY-P-specific phosphatase CheC